MKEWRNEGMKEWRNEGTKERRNEGTKERRNERTNERTNEWMKSRAWEDNSRVLLQYSLHVNRKFGRQYTKAPLAAALSPFMSLL